MEIYDPLYGKFGLSPIAESICTLPEVRRLSQIRLLNSITPTLATLSELRRYAHTLGVLNLFSVWKRAHGFRFSKADLDALEVSIILHDVATPPFGHLFEYVLKESLGWDHESAAVPTLLKEYGPASSAQQIFAGRTPKVLDYIERVGINLETVKAILTKKHALSALIFGILDFDNIDNVWRMSWALGLTGSSGRRSPEALASSIGVSANGVLELTDDGAILLKEWASLRRKVYEVLVFDSPTVASQSLLTYAIKEGISKQLISPNDWFLHDESLLLKLSVDPSLKNLIERQYLGQLPHHVITVKIEAKALPFFELSRSEIENRVKETLAPALGNSVWTYAFKEKGSFEKAVSFLDSRGEMQVFGETSKSIVISVFTDKVLSNQQSRGASQAFLSMLSSHQINLVDLTHISASGDELTTNNARFDF